MQKKSWLLPEGIDELLPQQAAVAEQLRRELLDTYASWGYQLVVPPVIEYLDSLLTGTGKDLEHQTFKLTDQMSGRQLGIRADITPQAARIDAHQLQQDTPTRLCYTGSVLRTLPDGFSASRSPIQVGAELYGHSGVESDTEVLCLMMETLHIAGLDEVYLDLGHVGIFRALANDCELDDTQESALFDALQRKSKPEINTLVESFNLPSEKSAMLNGLADLNGSAEVLETAKQVLSAAPVAVMEAIDYLIELSERLQQYLPKIPMHFDLAELRAYQYQTGVVFAAYVPGRGNEVGRGGRYDHIGEKFGRARPATGFSVDLKTLMNVGNYQLAKNEGAVLAPQSGDAALEEMVKALRASGRIVIRELPGQLGELADLGITEVIQKSNQEWALGPLS